MSRDRKISIAKALSAQLHAAEEAIDTALSEAAQLIEVYISSRRAIHMSTIIANDVHQNTLKAMMALSSAQQFMTTAHGGLSKVQQQVGLSDVGTIPVGDKPKDPPEGDGIQTSGQPARDFDILPA
jgi:hypothetical protein